MNKRNIRIVHHRHVHNLLRQSGRSRDFLTESRLLLLSAFSWFYLKYLEIVRKMLDKSRIILYNILTYQIDWYIVVCEIKEEYAMQKRHNTSSRGVREKMCCCCCRNMTEHEHKI